MARFDVVMNEPFANYYNATSIKAIAAALLIYGIGILMYITNEKKYMPGKEFGTATFATPEQINKVIADKDDSNNRILSQNVRMSLDAQKIKLNLNTLIIGGAGAGKTFFYVKCNLMQLNQTSFVITDPKGEILRSCGAFLKAHGFNVKVLNLLAMEQSDCYNPFKYIREEVDIVRLVTNLISNTTPKNSQSNDPFWGATRSVVKSYGIRTHMI